MNRNTEKKYEKKLWTVHNFPISQYIRLNPKSPYIWYSFSHNGEVYRGSTKVKYSEFMTEEDREISQRVSIEKYVQVQQQGKTPRTTRFTEKLCKEFLEYKEKTGIKDKTLSEYERETKVLLKFFKNKDLTSISDEHLLEYSKFKKRESRKHNKNHKLYKERMGKYHLNYVVNQEIGLLLSIIRWSQDFGKISKYHTIPKWKKFKERRRNDIPKEDYFILKGYLEKHDRDLLLLIQFLLSTGCRFDLELRSIQWKDIQDTYFLVTGKGDKKRSIPFISTSKRIVEEMRKRWKKTLGREPYGSEFVFVKDGKFLMRNRWFLKQKKTQKQKKTSESNLQEFCFVRPDSLGRRFRRYLVECGLDDRNYCLYGFRHSFTTRMLVDGVNPSHLRRVLGHTDTSLIEKFYSHLRVDDLVREMRDKTGKDKNNPSGVVTD